MELPLSVHSDSFRLVATTRLTIILRLLKNAPHELINWRFKRPTWKPIRFYLSIENVKLCTFSMPPDLVTQHFQDLDIRHGLHQNWEDIANHLGQSIHQHVWHPFFGLWISLLYSFIHRAHSSTCFTMPSIFYALPNSVSPNFVLLWPKASVLDIEVGADSSVYTKRK